MTTEVAREVSPDLFCPNQSILFSRVRAGQLVSRIPRMSAVTYAAKKELADSDWTPLIRACAQRAIGVLYDNARLGGHRVSLFVASGSWQQPSPVVRHKKLWGTNKPLLESLRVAVPGKEIELKRDGLVRYAGFIRVERENFSAAAQVARRKMASALLVSASVDFDKSEDIEAVFDAAFPLSGGVDEVSIDWLSLSLQRCPLGDVVVRVSGSFDDPDAAIDLIVDPTRSDVSHL